MHDPVQPLSFLRVMKDDITYRPSIERYSVFLQDAVRAKVCDNEGVTRCARLNDLASNEISIYNWKMMSFREEFRDS